MAEKETITLDEEANQPIGRVESPTLALSKRTLCLTATALVMFFGAGLLAGAYGIDTSEDPSSDYKAVGQTIMAADTPRAVYSITPVSLGENRKGRKRMAIGDPVYSDPTDPVLGGSTDDRRGRVRILELQGGSWRAVGQDLFGASELSAFGWAVDLSSDGSTLAVGARSHDGSSTRKGAVYVYTFDDEGNVWKLRGDKPATDDSTRGDYAVCGSSVSVSNDGTRVAFSCPGDGTAFLSTFDNDVWIEELIAESVSGDLTLSADGMSVLLTVEGDARRVMDRVDTEWLVRGEIDDAQTVAQVGGDGLDSNTSVQYSMSKDASTLAGLFHTTDGNTMIRTFTFNGRIWKQFGTDMVVSAVEKDPQATNLALSDDGRKLVMSLTANVPKASTELYTFEYSWGTWEESGQPVSLRSDNLRVDMSSSGSMMALSYNDGTDAEDFVVRTLQQDH